MNQEQSIALWRQGKEAWNAWVNEMLAKRETLCTSGKWSVKADYKGEISPSNSETTEWLECAKSDFSSFVFDEVTGANFESFVFPGDADFRGAVFKARADFWDCNFMNKANFFSRHFPRNRFFLGIVFFCRRNFSECYLSPKWKF